MKKNLIFCVCLIITTLSVYAQDLGIKRSNSIGYNFLSPKGRLVYTKDFGIGNIPLTVGSRNMGTANFEYKFYNLFMGAVADYHFGQHIKPTRDKLDLYAGLTYGVDMAFLFIDEFEFAYRKQPFIQTGVRLYIVKGFGIYAQANFDISKDAPYGNSVEAGITFRRK